MLSQQQTKYKFALEQVKLQAMIREFSGGLLAPPLYEASLDLGRRRTGSNPSFILGTVDDDDIYSC